MGDFNLLIYIFLYIYNFIQSFHITYIIKIKVIYKQQQKIMKELGAVRISKYTDCQAQGMSFVYYVVSQLLNLLLSKV